MRELYNFPANLDGTGECIGIIELGGGFKTADLKTYFSSLGLPAPTVSSVSVDGGTNKPSGSADSADGEVMLDIEVAAAIAPKAKIVVYFTANTLTRVPRRHYPGRSRHREQAVGHLH